MSEERNPDLDIAIGEHAFRAGWNACEDASGVQTEKRTQTVDQAWSEYTPPEEFCGGGSVDG